MARTSIASLDRGRRIEIERERKREGFFYEENNRHEAAACYVTPRGRKNSACMSRATLSRSLLGDKLSRVVGKSRRSAGLGSRGAETSRRRFAGVVFRLQHSSTPRSFPILLSTLYISLLIPSFIAPTDSLPPAITAACTV